MPFASLNLRHRFVVTTLLTCAVTVAVALPAQAQVSAGQWEVGFDVGSANLTSNDDDFDLDLRTDVRGGYFFTDAFELEAQVMRADAVLDATLSTAMIDGVFNFRTDKAIVPYALVGVGFSNVEDVNLFGSDTSEDGTAFQLAVGSRFFVGEAKRLAVRVELSSLWVDTDLFDRDRYTSLTGGLTWVLGR
jgi:opacity protein-like surface antigen